MNRILFLALAALTIGTAQAQKNSIAIQHVEPMNWWVGMHNPNLQLLVHAKGIAECRPQIDYTGVTISSTTLTDNENYIFLNLNIAHDAKPGKFDIRFMKDGKQVAVVNYELKAREANSANRESFTSDDAIYLLMPDRFANANPANDDMPNLIEKADRKADYGRHGGDLQGVTEHIDYIKNLGMTALWMTPVLENNMPQSSYHGYAITNYYEVDARLGSLDEYKQLSDKLHQNGMKLIMDMVFNHCGTNHWWMKDLPCKDWIFQWNGNPMRSSYRLSTVADTHRSEYDLRQATEGWFDNSMADMNLGNELVKNYFIQNSIWWIETVGLNGIRQDTYPYPEKNAMREWNLRVREEYPNFNIVGEAWISEASKLAYWQKDANNKDGYNSELPTIMDFPLMEAIYRAFNEQPSWDDGIIRLYNSLANDYLYADPMHIMVMGENHDAGRLLTKLNGNVNSLKMATAFLATVRGIAQWYVGTEVLMEGDAVQHAYIRRDFAGGWQGDKENNFTARKGAAADMYDYTARLFNYRKQSDALRHGELLHFLPVNEVYVYFRYTDKECVMVVMNNSDAEQKLDTPRYAEKLAQYTNGKDIISEQSVDINNITIKAKTALVVELK
ncbi:MAG: glycoside hydrolase family 13 protein [Marinilabiliaceae bacterium]|nr:glycoside hydrolase family 13 protein [Marinilabiliaceae bacterium]